MSRLSLMADSSPVYNVVVFGESGVGKSSIINLVAGSQVARTSPDANACTTRTRSYDVTVNGNKYRMWDTPGLDGGSFGRFRAAFAERALKTFLRNLLRKDEPTLLVYCVRASRATRALLRHYTSVRSGIRASAAVPMAIVVTGLENARGDMEDWWDRNVAGLSHHGLEFVDHACITSIDDDPRDPELARTRRTRSQGVLRDLIFRNCIPRERGLNAPQRSWTAGRRDDLKGWGWVVWTCLVSTLLSS